MSDGDLPTQTTTAISRCGTYFAAGLGAFCFGFGDLIKNGKLATIMKMSETIHEFFLPDFEGGAAPALVLLVALGIFYCWIHGPVTRLDAFNRGLSVFAIFAISASSNQLPPSISSPSSITHAFINPVLQSIFGVVASAHAQENPILDIKKYTEQNAPLGQEIIQLSPLKDKQDVPITTLTLRDAKTGKLLGLEQFQGSTFTIKRPFGHYILEVETPGYRRTEIELEIDDQINAYDIPMKEELLPLSIQRLYGPESARLLELLPNVRYKLIGIEYFKSKDYENAIQFYDKAINEKKTDTQAYNFKGYTLFRMGKYDDALATLQAAIKIDPKNFFARLNSAKIYCAQTSPELAIDVMTREPQLSKDDLRAALQDKEFLKLCRGIRDKVAEHEKSL